MSKKLPRKRRMFICWDNISTIIVVFFPGFFPKSAVVKKMAITLWYLYAAHKVITVHYTSQHTTHHCTLHITAHYTSLHTTHHCTIYITAHYTSLHTTHHSILNITANYISLYTTHQSTPHIPTHSGTHTQYCILDWLHITLLHITSQPCILNIKSPKSINNYVVKYINF